MSFGEGLADHTLNTHTCGRVAEGHSAVRSSDVTPALGVFAQRELDTGLSAFEEHLVGTLAPAHLYYRALSTDGIRAAVQNIRSGHAAGHGAVNGNIFRIQDVFNGHHRRDRDAALIDTVCRRVRMAIDDAGHQILSCSFNDFRIGGNQNFLAHFHNLSISHQHRPLERSFGDGEDSGVLNDDRARRQGRKCQKNCRRQSNSGSIH